MRSPVYSMIRVPRLIGRVANAPLPWIAELRSTKYLLALLAAEDFEVRRDFEAEASFLFEVERVLVAMSG